MRHRNQFKTLLDFAGIQGDVFDFYNFMRFGQFVPFSLFFPFNKRCHVQQKSDITKHSSLHFQLIPVRAREHMKSPEKAHGHT